MQAVPEKPFRNKYRLRVPTLKPAPILSSQEEAADEEAWRRITHNLDRPQDEEPLQVPRR
jgi:hypothetical protein